MFFPLGALGAFGNQFFPGMESGMDVAGKYTTLGGQADFMKALQQAQLGQTPEGGQTPDTPSPGQSSERVQMPTPQAPSAPMQSGMMPPQGGFAGSIPGAQQLPQQPGGAQPAGVPPMQRMASADPSGGTSPGDSPHMLAVKGFEGYSPRATWDYKQYSGGYGTRATPGQQFTPQSADSAFQDEMWKAKVAVDNFAPGLPQGPRDALTSLTYNAGSSWMKDRLGQAVKAGNFQLAERLLQQYNHAGGRPLPGLTQRRQEEGRWMLGQPPSPQALAAGRAAEAKAAGQPAPQGPDRTDAAVLSKAVENLRTGNLMPLQQLAQLIERANPGSSPQRKFAALKAGMGLMNQSGQSQFNQLMSIMNYQERVRHDQAVEAKGGAGSPTAQAAELAQTQGKELAEDIISGNSPPDLSKVGTKVNAAARAHMHEQGFNMGRAMLEWEATKKQVATLNNVQNTRLRDGAVRIVNTIDEVKDLTEKMDLGGVEWWNKGKLDYLINYRGNTPEGKLATRYVGMITALREEMQTMITGGYAPSVASWAQANKQLLESRGKESVLTSLDVVKRLMNYSTQAQGQGGAVVPGGGTSRYSPPQQQSQPQQTGRPKLSTGDVVDGMRYKGGDPNKEESWEPAQ